LPSYFTLPSRWGSEDLHGLDTAARTCLLDLCNDNQLQIHDVMQVAALVFYIMCETFNKNQFVLNFVVCILLLAMDFWTVSVSACWPGHRGYRHMLALEAFVARFVLQPPFHTLYTAV
jgi:hypothetical protein